MWQFFRCLFGYHRLCGCPWCLKHGYEACVSCAYANDALEKAIAEERL